MKPYSLEWWWKMYDIAIIFSTLSNHKPTVELHYREVANWIQGRIFKKMDYDGW